MYVIRQEPPHARMKLTTYILHTDVLYSIIEYVCTEDSNYDSRREQLN